MITTKKLKNLLIDIGYAKDNSYLELYCELLVKNNLEHYQKTKTARHHIIPKHYFKLNRLEVDNSCNNIVILMHKDHALAHYYLTQCCTDKYKHPNELAFMYIKSKLKEKTDQYFLQNLDKYQQICEASRKKQSKQSKDYYNNLSEERKKQISEKKSAVMSSKITVCNELSQEEFRISKDELDLYVTKGFKKGRLGTVKSNISNSKKGTIPWNKHLFYSLSEESKEHANYLRSLKPAHKQTQQAKDSIGKKNSQYIYIHKDKEVIKIFFDQLDFYLERGWKKGNPNAATNKDFRIVNKNGQEKRIHKNELDNYLLQGWTKGSLRNSSVKGTIWIHNKDNINKRITSDALATFVSDGWVEGFVSKRWNNV